MAATAPAIALAARISTIEELEEMRAEVVGMALQLQGSAKMLAERIAEADRREVELERRRLDIARRHEEQLLDIESKSRRILTDMQDKLEQAANRNKEQEITVQDTLARLSAVQRDYDLLQSAMLRVQGREVTQHEQEVKLAKRFEEVQRALDASLRDNQKLRDENTTLAKQADAAKSAMAYYRQECKAAIARHNLLADSIRNQQARALAAERADLDTAFKRQRLAELTNRPLQGLGKGDSRPWSHEMALRESHVQRQNTTHDDPMRTELKSVIADMARALKEEEEKDRHAARQARQRKASHHREVAEEAKCTALAKEAIAAQGTSLSLSATNATSDVRPNPTTAVANRWVPTSRVVKEPEFCEISQSTASDDEGCDAGTEQLDHVDINISRDSFAQTDVEHRGAGATDVDDVDRASTTRFSGVTPTVSTFGGGVADTASGPDPMGLDDDDPAWTEAAAGAAYIIDESTEALLAGRLPADFYSRFHSAETTTS